MLTTANAIVQLGVDPQMRGRVMALYMAIFMGGTPLGAPLIGWIGDVAGPRWSILVGTVAVAVALVGATIYLVRSESLSIRYQLRDRPHLLVTRDDAAAPMSEAALR